jgi:sulfur carrier protein ThiS
MKVRLRNPTRDLEVSGPKNVGALLAHLDIVAESVIVIRNDELVTRDAPLADTDDIEIRAVTSGGAA